MLSSLLKSAIFLYLGFASFSCRNEEEPRPDCQLIAEDVENIISQYNSCSLHEDCAIIRVSEGCVSYSPISTNKAFKEVFEKEIKQLCQKRCAQKKGICCLGASNYISDDYCLYPLIAYQAECISGKCRFYRGFEPPSP